MFFVVHFESTLGPKVRLGLYYLHNLVKDGIGTRRVHDNFALYFFSGYEGRVVKVKSVLYPPTDIRLKVNSIAA